MARLLRGALPSAIRSADTVMNSPMADITKRAIFTVGGIALIFLLMLASKERPVRIHRAQLGRYALRYRSRLHPPAHLQLPVRLLLRLDGEARREAGRARDARNLVRGVRRHRADLDDPHHRWRADALSGIWGTRRIAVAAALPLAQFEPDRPRTRSVCGTRGSDPRRLGQRRISPRGAARQERRGT